MRRDQFLPPWALARDVWQHVTSGDTLFRYLNTEAAQEWEVAPVSHWLGAPVQEETLPYLANWWKRSWVDVLVGPAAEDAFRRWKILAEMLWAFDRARQFEGLPPDEIERAALTAGLPVIDGVRLFTDDASPDMARAYIWIRSFRRIEPEARTAVPIALYDPTTRDGLLATLELELVPGGIGEVAAHPALAFDTIAHGLFIESMAQAWRMALKTVGGTQQVDGRWRVRRGPPFMLQEGRQVSLDGVDGESAGGAAARGWWHLLSNRIPDAEIVVLAQVSRDVNSLQSVEFISQKVRAIVKEGARPDGQCAFDTIVVVGDEARRDAETALGDAHCDLRVVSLSDRSQRAPVHG